MQKAGDAAKGEAEMAQAQSLPSSDSDADLDDEATQDSEGAQKAGDSDFMGAQMSGEFAEAAAAPTATRTAAISPNPSPGGGQVTIAAGLARSCTRSTCCWCRQHAACSFDMSRNKCGCVERWICTVRILMPNRRSSLVPEGCVIC